MMRGLQTFTFHYASTLSHGKPEYQSEMQYLHSTMLLLYQAVSCKSQSYHFYLHSTMLLLYQQELRVGGVARLNLHSTMLLLYPVSALAQGLLHSNLHSTMLLLYPGPERAGRVVCNRFTFHYASTLSDSRGGWWRHSHIYIPLCFYFIKIEQMFEKSF